MTDIKTIVETHALAFWRDVDLLLSAENEPPATAAEIAAFGAGLKADSRIVFAIIRQRIEAARRSVKAA